MDSSVLFSVRLSLQVAAVLFGYPGAGKSMTLQIIAGLMTADEGLIRVEDLLD